jgi:drug/metabolite transporter (DMT)-like permease
MVLDPFVAGLVLLAALLHASWNALVKSGTDRQTSMALVMLTGMPIGLVLLPFTGGMTGEAWIWLAASTLVHCLYYASLLQAYRFGDLSQVYPIARGLGPLTVALCSGLVFSEALAPRELLGVAIVSVGIGSLAFGGRRTPLENRQALIFAVLTGFSIAAYTIIDARGVRAAHDPFAYIAWLNIAEGPWVAIFAYATRGRAFLTAARLGWRRGVAGGAVAAGGYGIAMWAFSHSGAAHVAALREVSVIFAAVIGAVLLGEGFGWRRVLAAVLVAGGLVLMNWKI